MLFSSFRDERYFWEIVIVFRKVGIVALSVFGSLIHPHVQALYVMLLIHICLGAEVGGSPYSVDEVRFRRHKLLPRLEFATLMMLCLTIWAGLVMFQLDEGGGNDRGQREFWTVLLIVGNCVYMLLLILLLLRECLFEKRENNRIAKKVWRRLLKSKIGRHLGIRELDDEDERSELDAEADSEVDPSGAGSLELITRVPVHESSTELPELPRGWEAVVDPVSERTYYYHEASETTQWDYPKPFATKKYSINPLFGGKGREGMNSEQRAAKGAIPSTDNNWEEHVDAESGHVYYSKTDGSDVVWDLPEGAVVTNATASE
jgi:hypothetical protein